MAAGDGRLWADSIVAVFPHLRPSPGRWGVVRRPGKAGGASLFSSLDDDLRHAGRVSYQKKYPVGEAWECEFEPVRQAEVAVSAGVLCC